MGTVYEPQPMELLGGAPGRAHAIGVCGVGVAGVAAWLARKGWKVSGCDSLAGGKTAEWLRAQGVDVVAGHDPSHIDSDCDILIHTAAVAASHPEMRRAAELGVPVLRRGLALAALLGGCRAVAVCGTHGKTTTTTFATRLLRALGDDAGWCLGGTAEGLDGYSGGGMTVDSIVVAESDESDGTLAAYAPYIMVVNNIEFDHMEHFEGEAALVECFVSAARKTRRAVIFGADSRRAVQVAQSASVQAIGFGFCESAEMRATNLRMDANGTTFEMSWRGAPLGDVRIDSPGRHNVLNALGAATVAVSLGHDPAEVAGGMRSLGALPERRFECLANTNGIRVVSDYSHHPTEIKALVEVARLQNAKRIVALFQPHRYTRTLALGADFPPSFSGIDKLVISPVFEASEAPIDGGHSSDLYARFRNATGAGESIPVPMIAPSLDAARDYLLHELRDGDLFLAIGAGDIVRTAREIAQAVQSGEFGCQAVSDEFADIRLSRDYPLGRHTGYGVGGCADWFAAPANETELGSLVARLSQRGIQWRVAGAGMNTLVSDLGVSGVVISLDAPDFTFFERTGDETVRCGAGLSGAALLDRLEREGLSGLEFLEGVPGRLGGFLAMNAGAHGDEICSHVESIHHLNGDGSRAIIPRDDLAYGYRECESLVGRIALGAEFRLKRDTSEAIRERRAAFRAKRINLAGMRTDGSVFKNPPGASAGKLIEEAGCKGLRVGGAFVADIHANVIAVDAWATASDVLSLIDIVRRRVAKASGIRLVPEVRILDRAAWPF